MTIFMSLNLFVRPFIDEVHLFQSYKAFPFHHKFLNNPSTHFIDPESATGKHGAGY